MNIFDSILKQQHRVEGRANALADEILEALREAHADLTGQLASLRVRYLSARPWEEESILRKKAFIEAQRVEVNRLVSQIFDSTSSGVIYSAHDVMAYVQTETARYMPSNAITFGLNSPKLDLTAVTAWVESTTIEGLTMHEWLARMASHSADRIIQAGRLAMIEGMSVSKTAQLLRQRGVEGTRPEIEAISRTFLMTASNHAREETIDALAGNLDFSWRYVATLDMRTCLVCGPDDGKVYAKTQDKPHLPRHINCRCTYVPVFKDGSVIGDLERPATKHDSREVRHRDGSTSTKFTVESAEATTESYSQWISRQVTEDPAFAKEALGKTRFELLRDGKISLDKMRVDGRIKRLSELP